MARKGRRARSLGRRTLARRALALVCAALVLVTLVTWIVALSYRAPVAMADGQPVSTPVVHDYHGPGCAYYHAGVRYLAAWGGEGVGLIAPMVE